MSCMQLSVFVNKNHVNDMHHCRHTGSDINQARHKISQERAHSRSKSRARV